jgi:hypothetical protein
MSKEIAIAEIRTMADSATKSGMFPVKSKEQAFTLMLIAQAENIHPMSAFMKYDIIQGKPALKSTEVLSRFQHSGGKVQWIETNDEKAIGKFSHPNGGEITLEWNMERATKAGYAGKDNWKKHPSQMLRARCVTEAVRAIYPSCLNNMYSADEVIDFTSEEVSTDEVVEVIEVDANNVSKDDMKKSLARKLLKQGYSNAMIKDFAEYYSLNENIELLEDLVNDDEKLNLYMGEFENGN